MINLPEVFMFKAFVRIYVAVRVDYDLYHMEHLEKYNPFTSYYHGGWTEREIRAKFDNGYWTYLGPIELPDEDVDIEMKNLEEIL